MNSVDDRISAALRLIVKAQVCIRITGMASAECHTRAATKSLRKRRVLSAIDHAMKAIEICFGTRDEVYCAAALECGLIEADVMKEFRQLAKEILDET